MENGMSSLNGLRVTVVTRRNLIDELLLMGNVSGKLDLVDFLKRAWPLDQMSSTDARFDTAAGDIWQHMVNNDDWSYDYLFGPYLGLMQGSDDQFLRFLEQIVHPLVRGPSDQEQYVSAINKHLARDGFKLQAREQISGYPVYRVVSIGPGVEERVKNLIFAADGPKPEIVLADSISNDIQIVKNAEFCLVYDLPIPQTGLLWADLVAWWADQFDASPDIEVERDLYRRLEKSLSSEPERLLFDTYFRSLRREFGDRLPALIPQVYLHYDPYTLRELKGARRLPRQRMDFLILFSNYERIVIEVDGKQHYADGDKAKPQKYAEMVAADRELRLAGYEVYRFGGYELQGEGGRSLVEAFFRQLLRKYGILTG
jgi:very-short-patch-repair endonuclease